MQVVDFVSEDYRHKTRERIWVRAHVRQVGDTQRLVRYCMDRLVALANSIFTHHGVTPHPEAFVLGDSVISHVLLEKEGLTSTKNFLRNL